ncbi:hypothetical protein NQ176_g3370 [Zarea fungicola]|uniref:Uncharacterized protein n=1 Tax=Zarea fungicola TaxID=93591 RepID=A0ACC1NL44_9HYPO|nr:hypothetical protein NQ176_g3370 [Lecanicillium fungicola]
MLELCGCIDVEIVKNTVPTDKETFLAHSIIALSSLYLTDVEAASHARFDNAKAFTAFYRSKAQALSRALSDEPSGIGSPATAMPGCIVPLTSRQKVLCIQANLVLGLCELLTMATYKSWLHVGLAIRMAQALRMRREFNRRLAPRQREIRRRTFWACVILDRLVAYCTHRTQTIDLSLIKLHLPCTEVDFAFGHESSGPMASELDGGIPTTAAEKLSLAYFIKTFLLWSPIAQIYVDGGRRTDSSNREHPLVRSRKFEAAMSAWRDSLPDEMQWSERNLRAHQSIGQISHFATMHLLIQHAMFLSHHEYLPHSEDADILQGKSLDDLVATSPPSDNDALVISICLGGANQVVSILKVLESVTIDPGCTPLGICAGIPLVTAASVLLWTHHCSSTAALSAQLSDSQVMQAKADVDHIVSVLDSWAVTWQLARAWANCIRLLDEFYQTKYLRINRQPVNGASPTALQPGAMSMPASPTPLCDGDGYPDSTMIPNQTYYKVRLITGLILEQPELCRKLLQTPTELPEPENQVDLWEFDIDDFTWMNDSDLVMAAATLQKFA